MLVCDRCGLGENLCNHALDKDYLLEHVDAYRRGLRNTRIILATLALSALAAILRLSGYLAG